MSLKEIINLCTRKNASFAIWHLPNSERNRFIIEHDENNLSSNEEFVFYPFEKTQNHSPISIRNNFEYIEGKENTEFLEYIENKNNSKTNKQALPEELSKEEYLKLIESAKGKIASGTFQKVVLSRVILESKTDDFDLGNLFLELSSKYSDAFVYLINHPECGTWMGASPEVLLSKKNGKYQTASLAATKSISNEDIAWNEKELDEQNIVTESIFSKLKVLDVSDIKTEGPKNKNAGSLVHLQTLFSYNFEGDYSNIAKALHPTPAICGYPEKEALDFILKNEKYERTYYTGYLGPVGKHNVNLFVNLRCMQIFPTKLALYVGGGITADSISEDEWKETQNKAETLLSVIRNL